MDDLGFTHVALSVTNLSASVAFYQRYGNLVRVHDREDYESGARVAWMSDARRPFALVLVEQREGRDTPLGPFGHLGIACATRDEVDRLCALAEAEGHLRAAPQDSGESIGYWAFLADPDGNTLELSFGQRVETITETVHVTT